MKKTQLKQLIKEEILKLIKENTEYDKYSKEISLMTSPKIQQGWVDFYNGKINGEKLKTLIKSICVGFDSNFYEYVDDMFSGDGVGLAPRSSGSKLSGFYDFDVQDSTNLSDEEFKPLYNKMESAYKSVISKLNQ